MLLLNLLQQQYKTLNQPTAQVIKPHVETNDYSTLGIGQEHKPEIE